MFLPIVRVNLILVQHILENGMLINNTESTFTVNLNLLTSNGINLEKKLT